MIDVMQADMTFTEQGKQIGIGTCASKLDLLAVHKNKPSENFDATAVTG